MRVTTHAADDYVPSWSRDGLWICFGSTRSGTDEVWKVAPRGGEPVQVTRTRWRRYAKESVDERATCILGARRDVPRERCAACPSPAVGK